MEQVLWRCLMGLPVVVYLSLSGYKKKKLSLDGSIASFLVGVSSFAAGVPFVVSLLTFYITSSELTKVLILFVFVFFFLFFIFSFLFFVFFLLKLFVFFFSLYFFFFFLKLQYIYF
jgi:hypothetical protein